MRGVGLGTDPSLLLRMTMVREEIGQTFVIQLLFLG